jgi:starch phosphorylase
MEFLLGKLLMTNLVNLEIRSEMTAAINEIGYNLDEIAEYEPDAGLGNGGLGRLAACFLDSLSTQDMVCTGSGIRYEYGIFHQNIVNGEQKEAPEAWLARGNPWELMRSDVMFPVSFYGYTEEYVTAVGEKAIRWYPGETIMAMAYDILIPGYGTRMVNNLRLWAAKASADFNLDYFNHGDYIRAVEDKVRSESVSKVLYPNENVEQGRELRLKQEYFLVSATLQDAIRSFLKEESDLRRLPDRVFFQMNDTHPAITVAELMRLLVDSYDIKWEEAWSMTQRCLGYTNHTVMPEALERWDLDMFSRLLPRHMEIIYKINMIFLEELKMKGASDESIRNISVIEESPFRKVRMANLAIMGSTAVNGVAALHTELLKKELFTDFYRLFPEKFQNKTNGIAHRRWIVSANPDLTSLISEKIGKRWIMDLEKIHELENYSDDEEFQNRWDEIRNVNKHHLAKIIQFSCGIVVNPQSIFDVQIKRIHEYKRQLLNALRLICDYQKLKANPSIYYTPRTVIFGGKSAPGYYRAKLIIRLIHAIADFINRDPDIEDRLKVVFLPNYSVSLAEKIFPASDLSEQISTAGTEASGTGNMKFMLNGALTVGTLDGANIEIMEEAGPENIYIFGRTVEEIRALEKGGYDPVKIYENDREIQGILNTLKWNYFNPGSPGLFQDIFHSLTYGGDRYFLLEDFHAYYDVQKRIASDYLDRKSWIKKSILNSARSGKFSADRTIKEYASDIWNIKKL